MSGPGTPSNPSRTSPVRDSSSTGEATPANDGVLVRRYQSGQSEALVEIIDRHQVAVRRLLLTLWDDRHEVDDLCQEVFLRLIRRLPEIKPPDSLRPWLYRIAVNLVRDRARRLKVRRWLGLTRHADDDLRSGAEPPPDVRVERQEAVDRLRRLIARLDRSWREVVVLRDLHGLSPTETAELLDMPVRLVNDRLYRARKRLAEQMQHGGLE